MKKNVFKMILVLLCFTSISRLSVHGQCGVTFSTQSYGATAVQINLSGVSSSLSYSVNVDWGDGQTNLGFEDEYIHTYANQGTYSICIEYITVEGQGCYQELCNTYTISPVPANLCPLTVTPSLVNYTLTVNATGSGATDPVLSFIHDIWAYIADPFDFSLIQVHMGNTNTFNYTYPSNDSKTYTYCVGYGDNNEPEACEANDYCSNVSFGAPFLGLEDEKNNTSYLQVYPIPANDYLTVNWVENLNSSKITFEINDLSGKLVDRGVLSNQNSVILFAHTLLPGTYFLTVKEEGGKTNTVKFIKN